MDLHADWPPPLDNAARRLRILIMPRLIRRLPVQDLTGISDRLTDSGFSPSQIFQPYRDLLIPEFARDYGRSY